jgi:hypothetical protein
MADIEEQFVFTTTDEELAGYNCPICDYPIVIEYGLEVCYQCGWSTDAKKEGDKEE